MSRAPRGEGRVEASARRGPWRVVAPALRAVALVVAGLVVATLSAYAALTWTGGGRDWVRRQAEAAVSRLLVGQLSVGELSQLGPTGVRLSGVVLRDARGEPVLEVGSLALDLAPADLLDSKLTVRRLSLAEVAVDLSDFGSERGLLAALAPAEPVAPPPESSGGGLEIELRQVVLSGVRLRAEPAPGEVWLAEELAAEARLELRDTWLLELEALSGRLTRQGEPWGVIHSASAGASGQGPVRLELSLSLAKPALPAVRLSLRGVLGEAALRDLSLRLTAGGASLSFDGSVGFDAEVRGRARLDVPSIAGALAMLPQPGLGDRVPAALRGLSGSLGLDSQVHWVAGSLRAEGDLTLVELSADEPKLSAPRLQASFTAEGPPRALELTAQIDAKQLRVGSRELAELGLALRGNWRQFDAELRVVAAEGHVESRLSAEVGSQAVELGLSASGSVLGQPVSVSVRRARAGFDGALRIEGLRIGAFGQRLEASGRRARTGEVELQLDAPALSLSRVAPLLGVAAVRGGVVGVSLRVRGQPRQPAVDLRATAAGVRLAGPLPPLAVRLDASADLERGAARMQLGLEAEGRPLLSARVSAELPPGFDEPAKALREALVDADIDLPSVEAEQLERWLGRPVPAGGEGALQLSLVGPVLAPRLRANARWKALLPTPERAVTGTLRLDYDRGNVDGDLAVDDARGELARVRVTLEQAGETLWRTLQEASQDPTAWLARLAWRAEVDLPERAVASLPGLQSEQRGVAQGVTAGAHLRARRASRGPLEVELEAAMTVAPGRAEALVRRSRGKPGAVAVQARRGAEQAAPRCRPVGSKLTLMASLTGGQLRASADLRRAGDAVATIESAARLSLPPPLGGQPGWGLSKLSAKAHLSDLDFAEVPFLCSLVSGHARGRVQGRALLSSAPALDARISLQGLRVGRSGAVDAELSAEAKLPAAKLALDLRHGSTGSRITARVPLTAVGGRVDLDREAPLSARLSVDRAPLALLSPPGAAISRVSGALSAFAELSGTLSDPDVRGTIELHDAGFTATALAQPLHDINGEIALSKDHLEVKKLTARDGDGTLQLRGRLEREPDAPQALTARLRLKAEQFPLRQQGRIAGYADAEVGVDARVEPESIEVSVELERVSVALESGASVRRGISLQPHPDIVDPRAPPPVAEAEEGGVAQTSPTPLLLELRAEDSVWVRRDDFAIKLDADLRARGEGGTFRVEGPVVLRRGYLELLGRVFELEGRSKLEFVGSSPPDPVLDLHARARGRAQGEDVQVTIRGRASAPSIEFLVDDQVVTAGRAAEALTTTSQAAAGAAIGQAQSIISGMTGGLMALFAKRELGNVMPILMVEPGDGTTGSRVRAGFELTSLVPRFLRPLIRGIYVEGIIASGSGDQNQSTQGGVLMELFFPYDLVGSGQYGPGETWSVDLGWEP